MLEALRGGELGDVPEAADRYKGECHKLFPLATAFAPAKVDNTDNKPSPGAVDTQETEPNGTEPPRKDDVVQ